MSSIEKLSEEEIALGDLSKMTRQVVRELGLVRAYGGTVPWRDWLTDERVREARRRVCWTGVVIAGLSQRLLAKNMGISASTVRSDVRAFHQSTFGNKQTDYDEMYFDYEGKLSSLTRPEPDPAPSASEIERAINEIADPQPITDLGAPDVIDGEEPLLLTDKVPPVANDVGEPENDVPHWPRERERESRNSLLLWILPILFGLIMLAMLVVNMKAYAAEIAGLREEIRQPAPFEVVVLLDGEAIPSEVEVIQREPQKPTVYRAGARGK